MTDKIPVRATYSGADVVGLSEYQTGETVPVASGGTGVSTITGVIKGNGAAAFSAAVQADITALLGAGSITNTMLVNSAVANLSGTNTGDQTISDATITLTDVTTNNASTTKHGFLPKLSNVATQFLNGQGNFATPAGTTTSYLTQAFTAQTSVNVAHNFGTYPVVQIIDNTGAVIIPQATVHNTVNDFTITLAASTTGNIIASVGSPQPQAMVVTANDYTTLATDYFIKVTASAKTITLLTSVGNAGRVFHVINTSNGTITVTGTSGQTINGLGSVIVPASSTLSVVADGTNYFIY